MANRIPEENAWGPGGDAKAKYPWDEWLDGDTWLLRHGADFTCSAASMRAMTQTTGSIRGFRVRTKTVGADLQIKALL